MDHQFRGTQTFGIMIKTPLCPICRQSGQKVNIKSVRSLLKQEKADHLPEAAYFICLTPDCAVSYYAEAGDYFNKADLTVPIWFKEASPVPICYCQGVTDLEILDHVVKRQCCSTIEDIQLHTGASAGKECLTKNPSGK